MDEIVNQEKSENRNDANLKIKVDESTLCADGSSH
jgi:hypothetical protein